MSAACRPRIRTATTAWPRSPSSAASRFPPATSSASAAKSPPEEAAAEYEQKLAAIAARFGEERYRHDVILLGMGEDGHTASLFPGSPALDETARNVIPATGPKPPPQRVTFTYPLLNAARHVIFLVTPENKERVLEGVARRRPAIPLRPRPPHGWRRDLAHRPARCLSASAPSILSIPSLPSM